MTVDLGDMTVDLDDMFDEITGHISTEMESFAGLSDFAKYVVTVSEESYGPYSKNEVRKVIEQLTRKAERKVLWDGGFLQIQVGLSGSQIVYSITPLFDPQDLMIL